MFYTFLIASASTLPKLSSWLKSLVQSSLKSLKLSFYLSRRLCAYRSRSSNFCNASDGTIAWIPSFSSSDSSDMDSSDGLEILNSYPFMATKGA